MTPQEISEAIREKRGVYYDPRIIEKVLTGKSHHEFVTRLILMVYPAWKPPASSP